MQFWTQLLFYSQVNSEVFRVSSRYTYKHSFFSRETNMLQVCSSLQVTVTMGDDYDEEVLRNVRKTAGRSKKLVGELHNLKAKIYSLENDVRHMGWHYCNFMCCLFYLNIAGPESTRSLWEQTYFCYFLGEGRSDNWKYIYSCRLPVATTGTLTGITVVKILPFFPVLSLFFF